MRLGYARPVDFEMLENDGFGPVWMDVDPVGGQFRVGDEHYVDLPGIENFIARQHTETNLDFSLCPEAGGAKFPLVSKRVTGDDIARHRVGASEDSKLAIQNGVALRLMDAGHAHV